MVISTLRVAEKRQCEHALSKIGQCKHLFIDECSQAKSDMDHATSNVIHIVVVENPHFGGQGLRLAKQEFATISVQQSIVFRNNNELADKRLLARTSNH